MVGAVFQQEMMLAGRRFGLHALRWAYGAWLVLQLCWFYIAFQAEQFGRWRQTRFGMVPPPPVSAPEPVGARFAQAFLQQQAILLLLLVPACIAGAVTDEKRKGTLQHLLLTDLEVRHLVVGKMLARVLQVLLVLVAGFPLFGLMAGFGGLPPVSILFAGLGLVLPIAGLSAMTLLASVWCRQTRDAVIGLYAVFGLLALLVRLVPFLRPLDPMWVVEPVWGPSGGHDLAEAWSRLAVGSAMWGVVVALCLFLATARLRPVYLKEMQDSGQGKPRWYAPAREPITESPVEWRERHIEGLAPTASLRAIPQWLGIALVSIGTFVACLLILGWSLVKGATYADLCRGILGLDMLRISDMMPEASTGFLILSVAAMLLFSLVVGIRTSGAITSERERGTWEALLLTPQTARAIIHGKLWGVMSASYGYLIAYAGPAVALSVVAGPVGFAYTLVWLAVTVLAMYFIGAAGLWCSVHANNPWRSLLNTVLVGYLGGLAVYAVTSPGILIVMGVLILFLVFIDLIAGTSMALVCLNNREYLFRVFWVSSAIGLALIFFFLAGWMLRRAQLHVAERDRTRHWEDESARRFARR